jgi:hypothetical protein
MQNIPVLLNVPQTDVATAVGLMLSVIWSRVLWFFIIPTCIFYILYMSLLYTSGILKSSVINIL